MKHKHQKSMKSILIHIGTPKTGSTSIQKWLADAQDQGKLKHLSYPLWKGGYNHQQLVSIYKSYDELSAPMRYAYGPEGRPYQRKQEQYRKFLFQALQADRNAIISSESLCGLLPIQNIKKIRNELENAGFYEFHILL
jgi:hypothetical protein